MVRYLIQLFFLFFLMASCSSFHIEVASEPSQASVYLKQGNQLKKVGETPLKLTSRELSGFEAYQISIQKEGFQTRDIYLQPKTLSARAKIHTTLKKEEKGESLGLQRASQDIETAQRQLASIQGQILERNLSQAETLARSFLDRFPQSAVGWSLLGNTFLLQNRNQEALRAYQRALEQDPENKETQDLIRFLKNEPQRRSR